MAGIEHWFQKKICANLRFNLRKSAGKLTCILKLFKVLKCFPQIFPQMIVSQRFND
jgi:hypothetical protein